MIIEAKTTSAAYKRGHAKAIAKSLGVMCDVRDMTGMLRLDASCSADWALLNALYKHVFGYLIDGESCGTIVVRDKDGKDVMTYGRTKF